MGGPGGHQGLYWGNPGHLLGLKRSLRPGAALQESEMGGRTLGGRMLGCHGATRLAHGAGPCEPPCGLARPLVAVLSHCVQARVSTMDSAGSLMAQTPKTVSLRHLSTPGQRGHCHPEDPQRSQNG